MSAKEVVENIFNSIKDRDDLFTNVANRQYDTKMNNMYKSSRPKMKKLGDLKDLIKLRNDHETLHHAQKDHDNQAS